MPLTHYIVIRRDLTFGEYSAQLAHSGEAWLLVQGMKPLNECTCIVKGIRNEGRLTKLWHKLIDLQIPHVAIREEEGEKGRRLAGQLTCVSLMPSEDPALRQLLNEFVEIKGLDPLPNDSGQHSSAAAGASSQVERSVLNREATGSNPVAGSNPSTENTP
jgi:hypothetical protein